MERFIKDSLSYMQKYGDVMNKIIESRSNYLLRINLNNFISNKENIIDNKDISIESLVSKKDWDFKSCKLFFINLKSRNF